MFLKKKKGLDDFFLSPKNHYSKKRQIRGKNIFILFISFLILILTLESIFESKEKNLQEEQSSYPLEVHGHNTRIHYKKVYKEPEYDDIKISPPQRETKRQGFNKDALIGSKQAVELLGKVILTSQKEAPLRAKVMASKNLPKDYALDFHLKEGALLLGKAKVDKSSKRLHINFHTLLIDKKRVSIQGVAFMPDGTFGVKGEYNSGELKKYSSRFGSNFIGGVSQGLKEKTITKSGDILELGGLKNAILNGLSLSFLDFAQDKARSNENPSAKIIIPDKTKFLVYFQN